MKRKIIGILVVMLLIGTTTIAIADWEPKDGHKMHFPQMPDPKGWDVSFHDWLLADDWKCSETGPVTDIHFWISWKEDRLGELSFINIAIYSNNPQGPGGFSEPLEPLWLRTFTPGQFIVKGPMEGDEGWFDPSQMLFLLHDHFKFYQINIKNIPNAFVQQNGTIYWLVIQMPLLYPKEPGWKTTLDKFMDTAVWGFPGMWTPVVNPISGPLDFAFVITGPPKIPDLDCRGRIYWPKTIIHPKTLGTKTATFEVGNTGDPGSLLNWQISSWPTWGNWSFSPSSGTGLPAGSWVNVTATCLAPNQPYKTFTGEIRIINTDNSSDYCVIDVSLTTPRIRASIDPLFINLLQRFFRQFPVLHWILNPN